MIGVIVGKVGRETRETDSLLDLVGEEGEGKGRERDRWCR